MKNKEDLVGKIFGYLIAIAFVSLIIWTYIDAKNNHNSYCDYNDCYIDPRI